MKRLRELLEEMSLVSKRTPEGAIVLTRDGEMKTYSKEEAAEIKDQWLKEDLEGDLK